MGSQDLITTAVLLLLIVLLLSQVIHLFFILSIIIAIVAVVIIVIITTLLWHINTLSLVILLWLSFSAPSFSNYVLLQTSRSSRLFIRFGCFRQPNWDSLFQSFFPRRFFHVQPNRISEGFLRPYVISYGADNCLVKREWFCWYFLLWTSESELFQRRGIFGCLTNNNCKKDNSKCLASLTLLPFSLVSSWFFFCSAKL